MSATNGTVLHFIDTIGPGGAETIFLQVAHGLAKRGWQSRTVVVGPGWVLDSVHSLGLPVDLVPTSGRLDVPYLLRLRDVVRRHGVRLIHAHLFSPAVYASAIGAWTGTPVVATFHGASDIMDGGLTTRLRYRLIDRRADVVCVSEALRTELAALDVIRSSRVHVIYNGTDPAAFEQASGERIRREIGLPADAILIGALGNMRPAKDFPMLLRAAALLASDRRLFFAIAGEAAEPLCTELRQLAQQLGIADRVAVLGFRTDVPDVLSAFDILAISSSTEGFSLAAIQAMAAGVPVVATRSGGPEEIVTDGVDGLLVPARNPEALAAGIRRIINDHELRGRLVTQARQTLHRRFSLDIMLDKYEALYRDILHARGLSSVVSSVPVAAATS